MRAAGSLMLVPSAANAACISFGAEASRCNAYLFAPTRQREGQGEVGREGGRESARAGQRLIELEGACGCVPVGYGSAWVGAWQG